MQWKQENITTGAVCSTACLVCSINPVAGLYSYSAFETETSDANIKINSHFYWSSAQLDIMNDANWKRHLIIRFWSEIMNLTLKGFYEWWMENSVKSSLGYNEFLTFSDSFSAAVSLHILPFKLPKRDERGSFSFSFHLHFSLFLSK